MLTKHPQSLWTSSNFGTACSVNVRYFLFKIFIACKEGDGLLMGNVYGILQTPKSAGEFVKLLRVIGQCRKKKVLRRI